MLEVKEEKLLKDIRKGIEALGWLSLVIIPSFFIGLSINNAQIIAEEPLELAFVQGILIYAMAFVSLAFLWIILEIIYNLAGRYIEFSPEEPVTERDNKERAEVTVEAIMEDGDEKKYKLSDKTSSERYVTLKEMMKEQEDVEKMSRSEFSEYFDVSRPYIFQSILEDLQVKYGKDDEVVQKMKSVGV